MSNSEEKVSKSNGLGLGIDPMQRLASFKPPRDFTLGAAKAKKVFTPNLNVSRNKNKGPTGPGNRDTKKDDKGKKDRKNDRNRNRPEIIKSAGVFSEGVGKGPQHASHRSHAQESKSPVTLQKPTIRVKDVVKIDKELEEQRISAATRHGDFVEEEAEDFKQSLDCDAPIRLPMDDIGRSLKAKSVTMKQEVQVKTEPIDEDMAAKEAKPIPAVKKEYFEDTDVVDLLNTDQPTLILIKFPDTLPGRVGNGAGAGDEGPRRRQTQQQQPEPSSSTQPEQDSAQEEEKCTLRSLEEGRIGKLRVHRSGRVTLLFGETSFEVSLGTKSAYHQEVVSVATDEASRSANVISLGELCHKLTAFPDWEGMFSQVPT